VGEASGQDVNVSQDDPELFANFYRVEYPGMVRLAHALTGSIEDAEDAVQEAFVRLNGRMASIESPVGYLRTTVVHVCRDRERRLNRERKMRHGLPMALLLSLEASEVLDVMFSLPYRQRAVLVTRSWGGWSEAQIADALGCRPGTVKTLASRGLERLKKEMPHE
jgi:RNA polymerase sigma factor (sigma-70 family)